MFVLVFVCVTFDSRNIWLQLALIRPGKWSAVLGQPLHWPIDAVHACLTLPLPIQRTPNTQVQAVVLTSSPAGVASSKQQGSMRVSERGVSR